MCRLRLESPFQKIKGNSLARDLRRRHIRPETVLGQKKQEGLPSSPTVMDSILANTQMYTSLIRDFQLCQCRVVESFY
jgi:hypothetical protein